MNGGKRPLARNGYTILEVMIVLAVSGLMFLIAASFINGKQARTAFTAGSNEFNSQIQDTVTQVTNGQFSDVPLNCTVAGSKLVATPRSSSDTDTGICMFLGKMLHFNNSGPGVTDPSTNYETLTIVGQRLRDGTIPSSLANATPSVASSLTTQQFIPQHFHLTGPIKFTVNGVSNVSSYVVGFFQTLPGDDAAALLKTGAQNVAMYTIPSLPTSVIGSDIVNNNLNNTTIKLASKATICLTDGSRYARITIGGENNGLTASNLQILGVSPDGAPLC